MRNKALQGENQRVKQELVDLKMLQFKKAKEHLITVERITGKNPKNCKLHGNCLINQCQICKQKHVFSGQLEQMNVTSQKKSENCRQWANRITDKNSELIDSNDRLRVELEEVTTNVQRSTQNWNGCKNKVKRLEGKYRYYEPVPFASTKTRLFCICLVSILQINWNKETARWIG